MKKTTGRQALARNIERLMNERGIESGQELARRAKVANSHIARMRNGESAATVDMLDSLADALGVEAWELLTDDEATRRAVLERLMWGPRITDQRAADHLPPAPAHEPPKPRRKRPRKRPERDNGAG